MRSSVFCGDEFLAACDFGFDLDIDPPMLGGGGGGGGIIPIVVRSVDSLESYPLLIIELIIVFMTSSCFSVSVIVASFLDYLYIYNLKSAFFIPLSI